MKKLIVIAVLIALILNLSAQGVYATSGATETTEQKNALLKAQEYLDWVALPYTGLIDILEYEQFSHEDAVYAADHCQADWNEQAKSRAMFQLNHNSYSYKGMILKLEYEGFTRDQAVYGADNCQADWDEQAVKSAKSLSRYPSFSRADVIEQMEEDGFSPDQVMHGIELIDF